MPLGYAIPVKLKSVSVKDNMSKSAVRSQERRQLLIKQMRQIRMIEGRKSLE
jgi:hypothetical protein